MTKYSAKMERRKAKVQAQKEVLLSQISGLEKELKRHDKVLNSVAKMAARRAEELLLGGVK